MLCTITGMSCSLCSQTGLPGLSKAPLKGKVAMNSERQLIEHLLSAIKEMVYKDYLPKGGKETWYIGMHSDSDVTDIVGDIIEQAELYLAGKSKVNRE